MFLEARWNFISGAWHQKLNSWYREREWMGRHLRKEHVRATKIHPVEYGIENLMDPGSHTNWNVYRRANAQRQLTTDDLNR